MNPAFNYKFDQMREDKESETTDEEGDTASSNNSYAQAGHIRNLSFVWPDGKQKALNYSYLVSADYLPQSNTIMLEFTTHTVTLTGFNLQKLFDQILMQLVLRITCTDARYNELATGDKPIVNDIQVAKNE
jgi:hypothetical protein